jgi:hypothetical protein
MGLVDPISTLRAKDSGTEWRTIKPPFFVEGTITLPWQPVPTGSKPGNVVEGTNYYQTKGCTQCIPFVRGAASWALISQPIDGFVNNDVSRDFTKEWAHVDVCKVYGRTAAQKAFE